MHWQILTKLCFLFKWVIFNLLPLSLSSPLHHQSLPAGLHKTAFYAISEICKREFFAWDNYAAWNSCTWGESIHIHRGRNRQMKEGDCKTGQEEPDGGHLPLGTASGVCQDNPNNPNPNPYNAKNNLTLRRAGLYSRTGHEGLDGGHLALAVVFAKLNELPVKLLSSFLRNYWHFLFGICVHLSCTRLWPTNVFCFGRSQQLSDPMTVEPMAHRGGS